MSDQLPDGTLRVAAAQATLVPGDVSANAARVAEFVRAAGADVLVLSELGLAGYEPAMIAADPDRCAVTRADPRLAPIAAACRETATMAVAAAARAARDLEVSALAAVFRRVDDTPSVISVKMRRGAPEQAECDVSMTAIWLGQVHLFRARYFMGRWPGTRR